MDKRTETKALEDWLRKVDKPLRKTEEKRGRKTKRKNQVPKKD